MIKRFLWFLPGIVVTMVLAGCGVFESGGEFRAEPINISEWPTSQPTVAAATSTPFAQVTLAPTATPASPQAVAMGSPTPSPTAEMAASASNTLEIITNEVSTALINRYPPRAVAFVTAENAVIRAGPGASYAGQGTLPKGKLVGILGKDSSGTWVYTVNADLIRGWLPVDTLRITGTLENAPVLPADPVAAALEELLTSPVAGSETEKSIEDSADSAITQPEQAEAEPETAPPAAPVAASSAAPPAVLASLGSVATARINRVEVEIRPAPSPDFAAIDDLNDVQEKISVLGLDESGQWTLVQPEFSEIGWVSLQDLEVEGSLENAPQVITAWVESNGIELRSGAGIYRDVVGTLSINTLVQVLGIGDNRSWVLVKPLFGAGAGWAPVRFLTIPGRLADLPPAPERPLPVARDAASPVEVPQPITPPRPISESKIVFQRSSGGDIMVINPDGTGLRRLTNGIDPALSPDGQTVAFTRWEGETGSLWLIGIDGSNERSILGFTKQAKGPAWSPDGSKIVINFQQGGRLQEEQSCQTVNPGDSPSRPPRNAGDISFGLDEEGDPQLCWTLPPNPYWQLRVVDVATGEFEDFDGGTYAFRPTWDPTREWRVISDGGLGLVEVDLNQASEKPITEEVKDGSPIISPDGRYLAVTVGRQGGNQNFNIHRLNADGSGRVQLTETPLWVTAGPEELPAWNHVAPAWSSDGSQIAFLTDRTERWEIWVMNVDGSNQRPLFSDEVNDQLQISYDFVDERVLSWR